MQIQGIPITNYKRDKQVDNKYKTSVYEFYQNPLNKAFVINEDTLSWVSDTQFNYKLKKWYLPYYTFEIFPVPFNINTADIDQFYEDENGILCCRFNYELHILDLQLNTPYLIYDNNTDTLSEVTFDRWIDDAEIDNDKLYYLYAESCYLNDGLDEHNKGYHYIEKTTKQLKNKEVKVRKKLGLQTYKPCNLNLVTTRDVRNYRVDELLEAKIVPKTLDNKKIRELAFSSYLYCCLRQGLSNEKFDKIQSSYDYFKLGKKVVLIVKGYWLNDYEYEIESWKQAHKVD